MIIEQMRYIDYHVSLEPLRLVTEPFTLLQSTTMYDRKVEFSEKYDSIRKRLLRAPRGHSDMYGALLTPPVSENSLFGVLFMYSTGMSNMCGHGAIAIGRAAFDLGYVPKTDGVHEYYFDCPLGQIRGIVEVSGGEVIRSGFDNVPSFVLALDQPLEVPGIGTIRIDVANGGGFMIFAHEDEVGIDLETTDLETQIDIGMRCKDALMEQYNFVNPFNPALELQNQGCCFMIRRDPVIDGNTVISRNFTVFGNRQFDKSPTGTGSSALSAILYKQGILKPGMKLINFGYANIPFIVEIQPIETKVPDTVIPNLGCRTYQIAQGISILEDGDPFVEGYTDKEDVL